MYWHPGDQADPKPLYPPKPSVPAPSAFSWLGAPSFSLTSDPFLSTLTSSRIMMRLQSKGAVSCNQWNETSPVLTTSGTKHHPYLQSSSEVPEDFIRQLFTATAVLRRNGQFQVRSAAEEQLVSKTIQPANPVTAQLHHPTQTGSEKATA